MRILYVAKHGSGGNDDEGAITDALLQLGHDVQRVREKKGSTAHRVHGCDMLLFHKWEAYDSLQRWQGVMPIVFWYFDLVDIEDRAVRKRCRQRVDWMSKTIPYTDLGFCTDGDWVTRCDIPKIVHLTQGADQRLVGNGTPRKYTGDLLFTGMTTGGGTARMSWFEEVQTRYGKKLDWCRAGVHGEALKERIAETSMVLCPDGPLGHRYYSNRVYNASGMGGFVVHPEVDYLQEEYTPGTHLVSYRSRPEMFEKIDYYLDNQGEREIIAEAGMHHTMENHTYVHRCAELMRIVEERLF